MISKVDLLTVADVRALHTELGRRAPNARVLQCEHGALPPEVVLSQPVWPLPRPAVLSSAGHLKQDGARCISFRNMITSVLSAALTRM